MNTAMRDFQPGDYAAMAEVYNASYRDYPRSAEDLEREDSLREAKHLWRRWVWEEEDRLLAYGAYLQMTWEYHPRKFFVDVVVHPEARRRGVGGALYEQVVAALADFEPIALHSMVYEDWQECRRFARERGFADGMRFEESVLDITAFEPGRFAADLRRVDKQGIAIQPWLELADDVANEHRFYELAQQLLSDMPRREAHDPPPFELWRKRVLESPRYLPALCMIALDDGQFIGQSDFWSDEIEGRLGTGLTGVRSKYRRRGIATALKVRALAAARELCYKDTLTWNAAENAGMLGVNRRLGFTPRPAWIQVEKILDPEALKSEELPSCEV